MNLVQRQDLRAKLEKEALKAAKTLKAPIKELEKKKPERVLSMRERIDKNMKEI